MYNTQQLEHVYEMLFWMSSQYCLYTHRTQNQIKDDSVSDLEYLSLFLVNYVM